MRHLLLALLMTGCGGSADSDDPEPQDVSGVEPFVPGAAARNWCCAGERFGVPVLACGFEVKPSYAQLCYCAGIVGIDGACTDTKPFTPGTLCTSADLVCW